ncbi:hypothetical protein [Clostridium fessum]|uniref:hypothetical protein n=1 Tax=Clostridium fessum TaxID=2126740 RepID=UPI00399A9A98
MAPEQVARERHRGMEPERGAGDRRRCMEPEPVAGERRRGKVQVPHMRLHRIRQRTGWAFCGRTSGRNM